MTRISGDWLTDPATQAVCAALTKGGAQALFVGGCVRNTLFGAEVADIDIATDALPEDVMALAKAADLKPVPTGIDHGTVTVVSDGIPHEVTTFRRDVATDGRRAVVAYATRVEEDAARRDFTMNALYATAEGEVIDPVGTGLPDLHARRVRFIGDAQARIREDYLRSLRYFRFYAWYGDAGQGVDPDAIAAIAANLDGLETLSRERVGAEMLKLLGAPDPAPSVAAMRSAGALGRFLPGADDAFLAPLIHIETHAGLAADALRRLAALGGAPEDDLRLSRAQTTRLERLGSAARSDQGPEELGYRFGGDVALDALALRCAFLESAWPEDAAQRIQTAAKQVFPVKAADLMPHYQGPALGRRLSELETAWIASDFAMDRAALLALKPSDQK